MWAAEIVTDRTRSERVVTLKRRLDDDFDMPEDANPFESLQEQIDDEAAHIGVDDYVLERLKHPS